MNKAEAEELGLLIAKIRIGDYRSNGDIADALANLFPKAGQESERYQVYVLFARFREEADGELSSRKFGCWALTKKDCDKGRSISDFRAKYHESSEMLQCAFEKYMELSGGDFDGTDVSHVLDSEYWEAAKRLIEEDYGWDLRWMDEN